MRKPAEAEEYHSKDFDWEDLKNQIENDPSLSHHFLSLDSAQEHAIQPEEGENSLAINSQAWQNFHARHSSGKFFKERRYLLKEFPELLSSCENPKLLEVGCGNGSTVLPILRGNKNMSIYACDCCAEALRLAKDFIDGTGIASNRFHTFCCDFSANGFPSWVACSSCHEYFSLKRPGFCPDLQENNEMHSHDMWSSNENGRCIGGVDFLTLIFTLSAVPHHKMPKAVSECLSVLKPGGLLLFRDYGLYDMTMLRFAPHQRVGFREYVRSDGTRSFFFCLDTVRSLFTGMGFIEVELEYCCVKSVNRRNGKNMQRVWIHGKFQRPMYRVFDSRMESFGLYCLKLLMEHSIFRLKPVVA